LCYLSVIYLGMYMNKKALFDIFKYFYLIFESIKYNNIFD